MDLSLFVMEEDRLASSSSSPGKTEGKVLLPFGNKFFLL